MQGNRRLVVACLGLVLLMAWCVSAQGGILGGEDKGKEAGKKGPKSEAVEKKGTIEVKAPAKEGGAEEIWLKGEGESFLLVPTKSPKPLEKAKGLNGKQVIVKGRLQTPKDKEPATIKVQSVVDPTAPKKKKPKIETMSGTVKVVPPEPGVKGKKKKWPQIQLETKGETFRLVPGKDKEGFKRIEILEGKTLSIKGPVLDKSEKFPLRAIRVQKFWEGTGPEPQDEKPAKKDPKPQGKQ